MSKYGVPYVLAGLFVILIGATSLPITRGITSYIIIICGFLFSAFMFYFFRDPHREPPHDEDILISPADGKIVSIKWIDNEEFVGDCKRISIFMNIFDVHIIRMPASGVIRGVSRYKGKYLLGFKEEASRKNSRVSVHIVTKSGNLKLHLIAGAIARRIVCEPSPGEHWEIGEKIGIIKFGSRVDFFVPAELELRVFEGMRVKGGETILGIWKK